MDLLATVRKEGTRGGTGDFKWSDVQNSSHREHYLGHSLMAPVGRWQKGRDLNWYAKTESSSIEGEEPEARAARERKEEIRRVKEAEEDALARALGLPVPDRNNANLTALGDKKDVDRALKETHDDNEVPDTTGRGIGYGALGTSLVNDGHLEERDATATERGTPEQEVEVGIAKGDTIDVTTSTGKIVVIDRDILHRIGCDTDEGIQADQDLQVEMQSQETDGVNEAIHRIVPDMTNLYETDEEIELDQDGHELDSR